MSRRVARSLLALVLGVGLALATVAGALGAIEPVAPALPPTADTLEPGTRAAGPSLDRHGDDDDDDDRGDDDDDDDDRSGRRGGEERPVPVTGPIPSGTAVVDILDDDGFTPPQLEVDAGGSVTFVNQHHDEHTATGSAFDTGIIEPGDTATVTFDTPGTYAFGCVFHAEMTGTIGVRDASGVVPSPTPPSSAPPASAALTEVAVIDFGFEPVESVVPMGMTVAWTVTQASPHTVTAADGSFDSGILDVGGRFQHTFLEPGTFAYACRLHPQMQGTIVVDRSLPAVSPLPGPSASAGPSAGP